MHPTQAIKIFGNDRRKILPARQQMACHLVPRPSVDVQVKFYDDRFRGIPPSGELNTRGVAEYSDFGLIERYIISQKRCKIGAKLALITNGKSHIGFRLVPNSVTLDDLKRRNSSSRSVISPNWVAFGRIR